MQNVYDRNATGMTADATNATVTIKPTDASTEVDGEYNDAFDGGIVWLYYNRKTAEVKPNPTEPGGDTDGNARSSMAVTSRVSFRRTRQAGL